MDPTARIDLSLIDLNLEMTTWERILANNGMINLGVTLRRGLTSGHVSAGQVDGEADRG